MRAKTIAALALILTASATIPMARAGDCSRSRYSSPSYDNRTGRQADRFAAYSYADVQFVPAFGYAPIQFAPAQLSAQPAPQTASAQFGEQLLVLLAERLLERLIDRIDRSDFGLLDGRDDDRRRTDDDGVSTDFDEIDRRLDAIERRLDRLENRGTSSDRGGSTSFDPDDDGIPGSFPGIDASGAGRPQATGAQAASSEMSPELKSEIENLVKSAVQEEMREFKSDLVNEVKKAIQSDREPGDSELP